MILTERRWLHIVETHPELHVEPGVVLDVVARPDERILARRPGEEWLYRHSVGPSLWIRVVVHYDDEVGRIVTAFPRRSFP